ncbi:MAG TPA: molybdate ABC transporter permease subunit, partial [Methanothrix sp.]|nr:molybdate ABC transporter permease subunit [Methanothrix sp.]
MSGDSDTAEGGSFRESGLAHRINREHQGTGRAVSFPGCGRDIALKAGLGLLLALAMAFIALPVLALFLRSPLPSIAEALHDPVVLDALRLSLMTSGITTLIVVIMGTPIAYVSARFSYPGKELADSLIDLPVIMPPAVAGIALLMAFGRMGLAGHYLSSFGISIAFTTLAVILAQVFVSSPFYIRQARTSFEDV